MVGQTPSAYFQWGAHLAANTTYDLAQRASGARQRWNDTTACPESDAYGSGYTCEWWAPVSGLGRGGAGVGTGGACQRWAGCAAPHRTTSPPLPPPALQNTQGKLDINSVEPLVLTCDS